MRRAIWVITLALAAAGCARTRTEFAAVVEDVKDLPPGFGVMVAAFEYIPGASDFPRHEMVEDAYYVAQRLSVLGYQAFVAPRDDNYIRVGIRASSYALADSIRKHIDARKSIDLGDGRKLAVPTSELVNLAELRIASPHRVR